MKKMITFSPNGGMVKKAHTVFKQKTSDVYRNVKGKYIDLETVIHSLKAKATIK